MSTWVKLLALTTPHGVKGALHTKLLTDADIDFATLSDESGTHIPLTVIGGTREAPIVRINGVNDRTQAERWRGKTLGMARAALPTITQADTYYITDLVGMVVLNPQGETLGTISDVVNYGAGDILEIAFTNGKKELFAFTKVAFPSIDTAARRVVFVKPDVLSGD